MGMIDEAGAAISPTQPPEPPEVPLSEARTEVMDAVIIPASSAQPIVMPPSFPPTLLTPPTPSSSSPLHTIPAHASSIQPVTAQPPCAFPAPKHAAPATIDEPPLPPAADPMAPVVIDELPPPPAEPDSNPTVSNPTLAPPTIVSDMNRADTPSDDAEAPTARDAEPTRPSAPPAPDGTAAATDSPAENETPTSGGKDSPDAAVIARAKNGEVTLPVPARRLRLPRPAYIADRMFTLRRRREDIVDVIIDLLAIVAIWTIGTVASATTHGVTMDVLKFQLVRKILILPVSMTEGLIVLTTPILVILSLALRRRLQAIIQALVTSVIAAIGGWIIILATGLLPSYLIAPLSVDRAIATQGHQTGFAIAINLVIVTLSALFTSAGEAQSMKAIRWGLDGPVDHPVLGRPSFFHDPARRIHLRLHRSRVWLRFALVHGLRRSAR